MEARHLISLASMRLVCIQARENKANCLRNEMHSPIMIHLHKFRAKQDKQ
jgi:hypothetical protein